MSSALERARSLLAANAAAAAPLETPPAPKSAPPTAAATFVFETPKLKSALDALEKRCDEASATLEAAIGDIEASALDQRLRGWFDAVCRRRASGRVTIVTAGMAMSERVAATCGLDLAALEGAALAIVGDDPSHAFARAGVRAYAPRSEFPPGTNLVALVRPEVVLADGVLLALLRRECAGMLWLAPPGALPPDFAELFEDAPFGVARMLPTAPDLGAMLRRALPEGSVPALAALANARAIVELAQAVQSEHARENERCAMQALVTERARGARSLAAEISTRKEILAQLRDDLARDLQAIVDELSRAIAQIDADVLMRLPMRQALDAIPALRAQEKLVYAHEFEIEERHQWWHGTGWERMQYMFPRKLRLTIPTEALRALSQNLTALLASMVSKNALRRIDAFDRSIDDFGAVTLAAGVDLQPASIAPAERARWERKVDPRAFRGMQSSVSGPAATLEERIGRVIDATCEKDLKNLHVDIDRKGPIGKIMEARTAVMGVSFLVMTSIRVSGAWGNVVNWFATRGATSTEAAASNAIPWNIFLNASLVGFFIILLGMVVSRITEEGKEGAVVSEKVADARDALEDKLLQVMERVVDSELGDVKALLAERRSAALDRLDHAIESRKLELEEVDRKSRAAPARPGARAGLAPLPTSLRGDLDKTGLAMRDLRAEYAARMAASAAAAAGSAANAVAGSAASAPAVTPSAAASETPESKPVSPALAALAERAAKRAAEANGSSSSRPPNPALAALAERAARRAAEKAAAANGGDAAAPPA